MENTNKFDLYFLFLLLKYKEGLVDKSIKVYLEGKENGNRMKKIKEKDNQKIKHKINELLNSNLTAVVITEAFRSYDISGIAEK